MDIFAELLHAAEEFSVEKITEIANDIYNSGKYQMIFQNQYL